MELPNQVSTVVGSSASEPSVASLAQLPGYLVEALVGRGGMGKVYRARHLGLGRTVAVKVIALDPDEKSLARFRDEARAVARLQHPNISQVYDIGTSEGRPFFAQEFLEGGSLAQKYAGQPQEPLLAAELVETIARAIQHCHDNGILHRDLKPDNILLAADGTPKVTDFGLAKEITRTGSDTIPESSAGHTRTGEILGTPAYMPPEQASGVYSSIGPSADVYALGAILYEALTGRPPFQGHDALQTLLMVLGMEPVPPRILQPKVPRDLETICLRCLEKQPRKRFASAAELAEDLRRFRLGIPIQARPVGFWERSAKWARRRKALAALLVVSVAFGLASIGGAIWLAISKAQVRQANAQLEIRNDELTTVNGELEKSKVETEIMLEYVLSTMEDYHFGISEELKSIPQGEKLRIDVLKRAKNELEQLYLLNPRREKVWIYLMSGHQHLGNALMQTGDLTGAEAAFRRGLASAEQLVERSPNNVGYQASIGQLSLQLAVVLDVQGKQTEGDVYREKGVALASQLLKSNPQELDVLKLNLVAMSRSDIEGFKSGSAVQVAPIYQRWIGLYSRMAQLQPEVPAHRVSQVEQEFILAGLLAQQKKLEQAEQLLNRSQKTVDSFREQNSLTVRRLRASYCDAAGNLQKSRGNYPAAIAEFQKAIGLYESLAKDFPNSPIYRQTIANMLLSIATTHGYAGQTRESIASLKKANEILASLVREYPSNSQYQQSLNNIERMIREMKE